ncbi:MAG: ankyrin repeat domain-containing protein [Verrucomicrobiaceae bacterium]|nr:MAG: ankyrin repeat domain-containing protein [Verrucomicrobiaceae bacterium]
MRSIETIPPLDSVILEMAEEGDIQGLQNAVARDPQAVLGRTDRGWTLLHRAAVFGHTDIVDFLLNQGADPNARDRRRFTPLHGAATGYSTQVPAMALLVAAGAKTDERNSDWQTPLMVCAQYSNPYGMVYLLGCGARLGFKDRRGRTALEAAKQALADVFKGGRFARQRSDLRDMIYILESFKATDTPDNLDRPRDRQRQRRVIRTSMTGIGSDG